MSLDWRRFTFFSSIPSATLPSVSATDSAIDAARGLIFIGEDSGAVNIINSAYTSNVFFAHEGSVGKIATLKIRRTFGEKNLKISQLPTNFFKFVYLDINAKIVIKISKLEFLIQLVTQVPSVTFTRHLSRTFSSPSELTKTNRRLKCFIIILLLSMTHRKRQSVPTLVFWCPVETGWEISHVWRFIPL